MLVHRISGDSKTAHTDVDGNTKFILAHIKIIIIIKVNGERERECVFGPLSKWAFKSK